MQLLQLTGDLGAHLNGLQGIQHPRGQHPFLNIRSGYRGGQVTDRFFCGLLPPYNYGSNNNQHKNNDTTQD
jgi:hypothetical protein